MKRFARADIVVPGAALVVSAVIAALGIASWPLLIAAAVPWFVVASRRCGLSLGGALVLLASLLIFELSLFCTAALKIPMLTSVAVLAIALGAMGLWFVSGQTRKPRLKRGSLAVGLASLLGSSIWLLTVLAAQVVPGASRVSWAMLGDAANNILFAREVVNRGGLSIGPAENPVPLPSGVLGFIIEAGRGSTASAGLLRHDVAGFAVAWTLLIMLACAMIGATTAVVVRRAGGPNTAAAIAAALASLLPLSWFVSGYPIEYGFFNTPLAFAVLLAAFVVYLRSAEQPAVALAGLAIAAVLTLAVWSPLVLIPGVLGLAVIVRRFGQLASTRGLPLVMLVVSCAIAVCYFAVVVVPQLVSQSGFLAAGGGIISFPKWLIVVLAVSASALALWTFRPAGEVFIGTAGVVVGAALGLLALLAISRSWSYYPLKFAWLACVMLLVLAVANAAAAAARNGRRRAMTAALYTVIAGAVVALLAWLPAWGSVQPSATPVNKMLAGEYFGDGDAVAEQIFELADPSQARLLWESGNPDQSAINFWLLQMWSGSVPDGFDLRVAAYGALESQSVDDLCQTVGLMDARVTIVTRDRALQSRLHGACPTVIGDIEIELLP